MRSFLMSADDLKWLRDTIPAVRPFKFAVAMIYGNEDYPSRIVLAERDHVDSVTVTLTRNDDAKSDAEEYKISIGKGAS